jgi:mono/diheme cytochrome c family protein
VGGGEKKKMAAKLDDPSKVWTLDDILKRGEKVYAANCAACHQANGKGAGPIKPLDGAAVVLDADKAKTMPCCSTVRTTAPCRPGSSSATPTLRL